MMNLKIYKLLNIWKKDKSLIKEANVAYKFYNGGDFIDVGAYNGFFSFLLSPKANKNDNFISCEPDNNAHKDLFENLSFLKKFFKDISYSLITQPINNKKDVILFHDDWGHPCFLDIQKPNNANFKQEVLKSTSIDSLVNSLSLKPSFIKIDTEGAEHDVFEGMKETLKNFKPKILLEKHPTMVPKNKSLEEIDNVLKYHNYKSILICSSPIVKREIWIQLNNNL